METKLCMNCFAALEPENDSVCPSCGWNTQKAQPADALPYGHILASRYTVGRAKKQNGEGFVYAALDRTTRRVVEIREFFPRSIASRDGDGHQVVALSGSDKAYTRFLEDFLTLSKGISRLRELSVVTSVLNIFTENNTAYAVYEYIPTTSLYRYVSNAKGLSWNAVNRLFMPVVTALGLINSLGIAHLGVSPETLRVTKDGTMCITGFSIRSIRQAGHGLEEELFPGYAAAEQYDPNAGCGEISDVYALAACMVFALTARAPEPAPQRLRDQRLMISTEVLRSLPPFAVTAIANAMQVQPAARTASFEHFRAELASAPTIVNQVDQTNAIRRLPIMDLGHRGLPPLVWLIGSLTITLVALFIVASIWMGERGMSFGDLKQLFQRDTVSQSEDTVPNMLNQSYDEWAARAGTEGYDFTLRVSDRIFNETVEEGYIISQSPLSGQPLTPGGTIVVTVSLGSEQRVLPSVRGVSYEEISALLLQDGFEPIRVDEPSDGVEEGYVIRYENVNEGDTLAYGSQVTVVVSSGPGGA